MTRVGFTLAMTAAPHPGLALAAAPPDFDEVYHRHVDSVSRCLLALGVAPRDLDDAVQDVFLVVHRRLGEFVGRSSVRTWVLSIAIRVAHDHRRRVRRKGGAGPLPEDLLDRGALPEDLAANAEALRATAAALAQLDERKREVFVLALLEELPAPEIAESLGIPVNTVYSRLRLAREDFQRAFAAARPTGSSP